MANKKAVSMTTGTPGIEITIWYNDSNDRIGAVEWNIPVPGIAARVRIWDSNVSTTDPVVDRTEGQGSGAENVPGNHKMVEVTDSGGTYMDLPPNITYQFNIRSV